MHRRALLASVGAVATAGLAGCLSESAGVGTPDETDTATDTPTDPPTDDSTATDGGDTGTDDDTDTDQSTPVHDAPFPPERDDVARVVWFREVSDPDSSLYLSHSAASVGLPDAEVTFTLHNETDRPFSTNFYDWALYRWEAGRWHRVAPYAVPQPLMRLEPGETHEWRLALDGDEPGVPVRSQGTDSISVAPVGGGHYAFAVGGWWENQDETPVYRHQTVCAARFELTGPALELHPSDAVTGTRREGDTVVVTADNPTTDEGDPAAYVLTRDDEAADPRPLVTEQVYRQWPLRDALAHAGPDVREVRVETTTPVTPPFGVQDDEQPIRYEGRTYRIDAERSSEN